jgi:hypothetical protein
MDTPTAAIVSQRSTALGRTDTKTPSPPQRETGRRRAGDATAVLAVVAFTCCLAATAGATERDAEQAVTATTAGMPASGVGAAYNAALEGGINEHPLVVGTLPEKVQRQLGYGYQVALQRLRNVEPCQGLFAELGVDGIEMLSTTIYLPPKYDFELQACDNGATAFTFVGAPQTRLCDSFGRLSKSWSAVLLIHEALHHAGLGERPQDPNGPTPRQINRMVAKSCEL